MVTYTVHEPPTPEADRLDRAEDLEFVKDGFSWTTAVFPPLGLAMHGLWLPALGYIVLTGALAAGLNALGVNEAVTTIFIVGINVYLGFELSSLRRWSLDNNGFTMLGSVTGRNLAECERRFFENWLPAQPVITASAVGSSRSERGWPYAAKA